MSFEHFDPVLSSLLRIPGDRLLLRVGAEVEPAEVLPHPGEEVRAGARGEQGELRAASSLPPRRPAGR